MQIKEELVFHTSNHRPTFAQVGWVFQSLPNAMPLQNGASAGNVERQTPIKLQQAAAVLHQIGRGKKLVWNLRP